jgi:hypothetical protein
MKAKQAFDSLFGQIEENRQFFGYYKNLKIPATPAGKEKQIFAMGAKVKPSPYSRFKNSIGIGEVYGFYSENGFGRYQVRWPNGNVSVEREKDLTAV